ncbi:hypothetical protein TIFTF001_051689 [Ficus carica]|uniref:Pollen Ole e 1 allergen and extensin family protein n=2 Tax=Ficus carica TaxID=3494 RepID=A0AA88CSV2_FICCA|nr:hypothetical protein TIFTF001_051689 [Ficus carica]
MALTRLILCPLVLLSLLVIATANYENYGSTQNNPEFYPRNSQLLDHDHHQLVDENLVDEHLHNLIPTNHENKQYYTIPQRNYNFIPTEESSHQKLPKPEGQNYNSYVPTKSPYYDQVRRGQIDPKISFVGVQGIILCESTFAPIQGAVARITCRSSNGYNNALVSVLSSKTDERGYFLASLPVSELKEKSVNVQECKAFLEYSPSETDNVPTNSGLTGAPLFVQSLRRQGLLQRWNSLLCPKNSLFFSP